MKILAVSGSIRKGSFNTRLLRHAGTYLPQEVDFLIYTCEALPLYNQDLDGENKPPAVAEWLELISAADALLIATPEYNYSFPGVLKNAIDWASRPAFKSCLKDKPAGIMSASMSNLGGIRAQIHLKQVLASTLTNIFPAADFIVPAAHQIYLEEGIAEDQDFEVRLQGYLNNFVSWVKSRTS